MVEEAFPPLDEEDEAPLDDEDDAPLEELDRTGLLVVAGTHNVAWHAWPGLHTPSLQDGWQRLSVPQP